MSPPRGVAGKKYSAPPIFDSTVFLESSMTSALGLFEIETLVLANIAKKVTILS